MSSILTYITPAEIAAVITNDVSDTIEKISGNMPTMLDIFSTDVGENVDSTIEEIQSIIGSYILNDGDIIQLSLNENEDVCFNVHGSDGSLNNSIVFLKKNTEGYERLNVQCKDISGLYTWSDDEIIQSLMDTYSSNDVVRRASQLVQQGKYSPSEFNAACSDIIQSLSGSGLEMYSIILSNLDADNPWSFITTMQQVYSSISTANVNDNTINFNNDKYYVKGFLGTFSTVITNLASTILNAIAFAVHPILGVITTLATTVWNSFNSLVDSSTKASINYRSLNRMYAQPFFQRSILFSDLKVEDQDALRSLFSNTRLVQTIMTGLSFFIWINDELITENTVVYFEVYGNCYAKPMFAGHNVSQDYTNLFNITWTKNYESGTLHVIANPVRNFEMWEANLPAQSVSSASYSDEDARTLVTSAIMMWQLFALCSYAFHHENMNSFDLTFKNIGGDSWDKITDEYGTLIRFIMPFRAGAPWSWEDIVNTVVPIEEDSAIERTLDRDLISDLIGISDYVNDKGGGLLAINIVNTYERGNWFITPPSYSRGAIIWTTIALATTATVTALSVVGMKRVISKRINKIRLNKKIKVEEALATYISNPTTENYNMYYKQARRYNTLNRITGGSTIDIVNPNEIVSDQISDYDNMLAVQLEKIIRLIR